MFMTNDKAYAGGTEHLKFVNEYDSKVVEHIVEILDLLRRQNTFHHGRYFMSVE